MKRVLVVTQRYWPEPFNVADVCEELVRRGHMVTVLTGMPNYPDGEFYPGYEDGHPRVEEHNGVTVIRVKEHPRKTGALHRVLNYLSFWQSSLQYVKNLDDSFDVVLGYQYSPVMQVDAGIRYAKQHHVKMLLYCFDLWPASLLAGGFAENSLPFRWMKLVSRRIYSEADRIAITSPLFDEYFRDSLGLSIPDSAYLPQYAEDAFDVLPDSSLEGYDPDKVNLTFAGNIGQAQSAITIIEAAAYLRDDPNLVLHIVGSGSKLSECEARARELDLRNVVFHGRHPFEEMPAFYAASDAMLVTFEDSPMATYTLPRKVTTYLAAGKPVLAALSGETRRVLDEAGCGYACETADAEGLARICRDFASIPNPERLGQKARAYYESNFTKKRFFDTLEELFDELCEEREHEQH